MAGPYQGLEDTQGVSEGLTGLLATELRNQRAHLLAKIKRSRHENLINPQPFSLTRLSQINGGASAWKAQRSGSK